MKYFLSVIFLFVLSIPSWSQEKGIEVFAAGADPFAEPYSLVTLDTLENAKTIKDIYRVFKSSWIQEYRSVKMEIENGKEKKVFFSKDDQLSAEQLNALKSTGSPSKVHFSIVYLPKNQLKDNPERTMEFTLRWLPVTEAKYHGGTESLTSYLNEQLFLKESQSDISFVKASFIVDTKGKVQDIKIVTPSGNSQFDEKLISSLQKMGNWQPARNADGKPIERTFEVNLGTELLQCDYNLKKLKGIK
ncbi:MAG: TonB family protein [Saprospiraceae bacterium]